MLATHTAINSIATRERVTKSPKRPKKHFGGGNVCIGIVPSTGVLCQTEQSFIPSSVPKQNLMVPWIGWG